jgi:hypothetical protein
MHETKNLLENIWMGRCTGYARLRSSARLPRRSSIPVITLPRRKRMNLLNPRFALSTQ